MEKIVPFLWFDANAEEAVNHYVSIFKNSKIVSMNRYGKGAQMPEGTVMVATFELEGQRLMALNGGPHFKLTEAISLYVNCEGQAEVDELWEKLSAPGTKGQCGWLKDRYGLSWQIIPKQLGDALGDKDPARAGRAMQAMLKMTKIDIAALERARAGEG